MSAATAAPDLLADRPVPSRRDVARAMGSAMIGNWFELFDFIILEVEKGPTDPNNGGVYAQRLTKVYLDHYLDLTRLEDEAYVKREKKLITKLLWWLVEVIRFEGGN